MNSNIFERKSFLDGNWIPSDYSDRFTCSYSGENLILKVNLNRASANEVDSLKKYIKNLPIKDLKSVIIDFRNCSFIDSTFLSAIINFSKLTRADIRLVVADRRQLTLFKITKLDSLFNIYLNIEQALVQS